VHLPPVEKMGAIWVENLTDPVIGGTSTGKMKSYLQLVKKNANEIKIRNIVRFFMVINFKIITKKDFFFYQRSLFLSVYTIDLI
jgi:hypothetical protein